MGRLDRKVALISGGAWGQGATEARLVVRKRPQEAWRKRSADVSLWAF